MKYLILNLLSINCYAQEQQPQEHGFKKFIHGAGLVVGGIGNGLTQAGTNKTITPPQQPIRCYSQQNGNTVTTYCY